MKRDPNRLPDWRDGPIVPARDPVWSVPYRPMPERPRYGAQVFDAAALGLLAPWIDEERRRAREAGR